MASTKAAVPEKVIDLPESKSPDKTPTVIASVRIDMKDSGEIDVVSDMPHLSVVGLLVKVLRAMGA